MNFLNAQIAALAKKKRPSLVRKQISCGIFQEVSEDIYENKYQVTTKNKEA